MSEPKKTATAVKKRTNYSAAIARTKPSTPKPGTTAIRTRPIRVTVDMPPDVHGIAKKWTRETAAQLGADVGMAEVIRLMFTTAAADRNFSAQLRDLVEEYVQSRDK